MVATVVTYVSNLDVFQIRKRRKVTFSWKEFENQFLRFTLLKLPGIQADLPVSSVVFVYGKLKRQK